MQIIRAKTVEGRIAREAPRGAFIPDDRYVPVERTHYVDRLLTVHGDIELEPTKQPVEAVEEIPPADEPNPRREKTRSSNSDRKDEKDRDR